MSEMYHPFENEANIDGKIVKLEGKLPLVCQPGVYKMPDIKAQEVDLDTKWISDWISEAGLDTLEGVEAKSVLEKAIKAWKASNYLLPRQTMTDERLKSFSWYLVFLALAEDLPEVKKMRNASSKMTQTLGKVMGDIVGNKYETLEDLPEVPPKLAPVIKALFLAGKRSQEHIPDYDDECTYLVETFNRVLTALPVLGNDFVKETPETFKYLKRHGGPEALIELSALAQGVTLPLSMRQNLIVQQIMTKACSIISTTCDVKKYIDDERVNSIAYFTKNRGLTPQEAFNQLLGDIEHDTKEFKLLCSSIRSMNKKNSRLDRFLKHLEEFIDGNTYGNL